MQIPNGGLTTTDPAGVAPFGTGVVLNPALGFRLNDPARGGVIQPLNIATGVGGLHKPSLRKAEFGGNGTNPNYLWNSAGAISTARPDPTGADLQPSNENDFVGLYGIGTLQQRKQLARLEAMVLGKSLFWDQQVGSDGVQACAPATPTPPPTTAPRTNSTPTGRMGSGAPRLLGTPASPVVPTACFIPIRRTMT